MVSDLWELRRFFAVFSGSSVPSFVTLRSLAKYFESPILKRKMTINSAAA
jgi:hypothetical protein